MLDKVKMYTYYILIACVSFIALVILPFVGSVAGEFAWPQTTAEWTIWVINRLIVSFINCAMFYCFMQQGKINVSNNENFKKANEILLEAKDKEAKPPQSPKKWQTSEYLHKGISILISTLTASIALTQMILKFDLATMVSYFIVVSMGLIFGFLQMKKAEDYWTNEYYQYALEVQKNIKKEEELCLQDKTESN